MVKKFDGEFVAVYEQRVIDHDKELSALMKRIDQHLRDRGRCVIFRAEDGGIIQEKLRLFVGAHDLSKLSPEEKVLIMRMPSLLGRDIIYRFRPLCDRNHNEIYLER